ncbi:protein TOC75, chloroplastic-like [Rhagoletis pomonella]|uniref:protein TOC75, chloroplastic-like n=1 Tax=Rhagoletis pomonella TaxID=28610 RepID=UPI0017848623|nr:protein TOC75, chloroplastic-like [Rhagoletis pomonella]
MKWRNSKERELLASGGSRDQTLPNKNNPNPDLSDAKCDRPISPLSPTPPSPPSHSLSPQPKEERANADTPTNNGAATPNAMQSPASTPSASATLHSPPLMHHIPSSVAVAAAAAAVAFSSAPSMQMSSPPPLLTVAAKLNANLNDQSSNASSSAASSPPLSAGGGGIVIGGGCGAGAGGASIGMPPLSSAEFQAKINAEMQKHLAAADLKFKLESTINEAKQRRINMLSLAGAVAGAGGIGGEQHSLQLHAAHPGGIFMSEALQASHNHQHQHHQHSSNGMHLSASPPVPTSAHSHVSTHAMPPFQNPEFMKMYYDDYDDSNSDSDEEISVT